MLGGLTNFFVSLHSETEHMESSQLEHRIILTQRIMDAWRTFGQTKSLADIIADYTFGMTRDELEEFLNGSIVPKLEEAWKDLKAAKTR